MGKSENNGKQTDGNDNSLESKPLPPKSIDNNEHHKAVSNNLRVDTLSMMGGPGQAQNIGSQKIDNINNAPASIMSASARTLHQNYQEPPNNSSRRNELPSDTRPERSQRPEDLRRARYLSTAPTVDESDKDEKSTTKKTTKKKPPTCWVTTSWILTWWAPPFMLRIFGKIYYNMIHRSKLICLVFLYNRYQG